MKGIPITEYCDKHHLPVRDRLILFVQVCRAVQHAHSKGLIHRDLKPKNILVGTQDGQPVAKVIDFGIAKALNRSLTEKTLFTEHHAIIGTLAYMSPGAGGRLARHRYARGRVFARCIALRDPDRKHSIRCASAPRAGSRERSGCSPRYRSSAPEPACE
ncbi:MAG: protein kinase [Candidatus Eisenbacteria bacterium]|nr:protein kinase [Candidatus Eisenbacteria bacterium]